MMIWATIAEYYTPQDGTAYLTFLVDDLDANTTALQTFLGRSPPLPPLPLLKGVCQCIRAKFRNVTKDRTFS